MNLSHLRMLSCSMSMEMVGSCLICLWGSWLLWLWEEVGEGEYISAADLFIRLHTGSLASALCVLCLKMSRRWRERTFMEFNQKCPLSKCMRLGGHLKQKGSHRKKVLHFWDHWLPVLWTTFKCKICNETWKPFHSHYGCPIGKSILKQTSNNHRKHLNVHSFSLSINDGLE